MDGRNRLISPIGGAVAAVCFFMPWVGCMGQTQSGADMGGSLWLVLLSAIGIVGLYLHFNSKNEVARAKGPIIACAVVGAAVMLLKYLALLASGYSEMFELKFGSIFSLLGFGAALYGVPHLSQESGQQRWMPPVPPDRLPREE